jgi:Gpi18-like mannosyltransferase
MQPAFLQKIPSIRLGKSLTYLLVGLIAFAVLMLSMYRMPSFGRGVEEVKKTSVFFNVYTVEQTNLFPADTGAFYAWTQPVPSISGQKSPPITTLRLPQVQRVNPFYLTLVMSLDRPEKAPPARVELNLLDENDKFLSQLAVVTYDPARPGFNSYPLVIPADENKKGLGIQIKSNAFNLPGQPGERGIRLSSYTIEQKGNPYGQYLWPDPYLPAAVILGLGILLWASRVGLQRLEIFLLLTPLAFVVGSLAPYNRTYSWLAMGCALTVVFSSLWWQRTSLPFLRWRWSRPAELWPLMLGLIGVSAFFLNGFSYFSDMWFYNNWVDCLHKNGPINVYNKCTYLDYPPLAPYLFYAYSVVAFTFGFVNQAAFMKGFFSLGIPILAVLIWKLARRPGYNFSARQRGAVLVMFGFNIALIYNPAIWGQMDIFPTVLLVAAFAAIYSDRPVLAAVCLACALLIKPQAIFAIPLLGLLLVKKSGFKRAALGSGIASLVLLALSLPAFGFDWNSFLNNYWSRNELAGDKMDFFLLRAYNFSYLVNFAENRRMEVILIGFGVITLVYLLLAGLTWFKGSSEAATTLALALTVMVSFTFAIKMHERYTYYALPFLALAVLYNRRASLVYLLISLVSLYQVVITPIPTYRSNQIPNTFYLWHSFLQLNWQWLPDALSYLTIAVFMYLLIFYVRQIYTNNIKDSQPLPITNEPEKDRDESTTKVLELV